MPFFFRYTKKTSLLITHLISYRYLQNYVNDLFAGAWEKREVTPIPVSQPMASQSQSK